MTKGFSYNVNKNCIEYDGKFVAYLDSIDGCRIANYWNGLYKENEQLKQNCKNYTWYKEYKRLLNENEQLKHRLAISEKANFVTALEKENEQLRKENEKLEALWEDKCVREYLTACGESILKEMHDEKYGDKE